MSYTFRVTVESLDARETPAEPLRFDVENHDDIFFIVDKMKQREEFSPDEAEAFGVGLKLFSEVMIRHKNEPLFAGFVPHFIDFMKTLKKG